MSNSSRGLYIAIEGIDGCGKGTQIELLAKNMSRITSEPVITREPSSHPIGKIIRQEFLSGKRTSDPQVMKLLYAADRLDNITNTNDGIQSILKSGTHVISDRCFLSSCAYDTYHTILDYYNYDVSKINVDDFSNIDSKFQKEITEVLSINHRALELCIPDIIFYIDVDSNTAMKRINQRGDKKELYEDSNKLYAIREAYKLTINTIKKFEHNKIFFINGEEDVDTIANGLMNYVEYELRERNMI